MKKPLFPRIAYLVLVYLSVFVLLVTVQFTRRGGFSRRVGDLLISGRYREPREGDPARGYPLSGGINLSFGGVEFHLGDDDPGPEGFGFLDAAGEKRREAAELLLVSDTAAVFHFSGGSELTFSSQVFEGEAELRMSGRFAEGLEGVEIPYRLLRGSRIRDGGEGEPLIRFDNRDYRFFRSLPDPERRVLTLRNDGGAVFYRALPEDPAFAPEEYVIPPARDPARYAEALDIWRDQVYALWEGSAGGGPDLVSAYLAESLRRGDYPGALASPAASFADPAGQSHLSAVFRGRLDLALRSLNEAEEDALNRLASLLNSGSPDFLKEPHVFAYLALRGQGSLLEQGAALLRGLDPSLVSPELVPGIGEAFLDWRSLRPYDENPLDSLLEQGLFYIAGGIRRAGEGRVYFFQNDRADLALNLRLGCALAALGAQSGSPVPGGPSVPGGPKEAGEPWAALGRSLILSVLSLSGVDGSVPRVLVMTGGDGEVRGVPGEGRIAAAGLYAILAGQGDTAVFPAAYYPRAQSAGTSGVWAWTAASSVQALRDGENLDMAVSFPAGETHYMLIRGLKPFRKLQLYDMDYRTDPQFERYDSSGWFYSEADQTLLVKMKHRAPVEHIRIFYSY
jgi:hypothetical protein